MIRHRIFLPLLALCMVISSTEAAVVISEGMALHGNPRYPDGFKAFAYVNPAAPKGGDVRHDSIGTFDSLNSFIDKGVPAEGLNLIYDTLTVRSLDEPFSQYGLLAERIERDPQHPSWIIFYLRKSAVFSDGVPVTADDVVFSFNTLMREGDPSYRLYYADVSKVEALSPQKVKFTFKTDDNRELPHIIGELPVLPKHYWEKREFRKTSLDIPVGSGPYIVKSLDAGKSITYARNPSYWGRDLPVMRGQHNIDLITYRYYRDITVALEAFKAGQYDLRMESMAKLWATAYNFPAMQKGLIQKQNIRHYNPTGMQAFAFNLRRPQFQDVRVRQALGLAFDFEWSNKALFNSAYTRTASYFSNSELAATGAPSKEELALLTPFKAQLPASVFAAVTPPPKSDGSGNIRNQLLKAQQLLQQAGWVIRNGKLVNNKGDVFQMEMLLAQPEFERVVQPYARNLSRLGITLKIRVVDIPQYIERVQRKRDFDVIVHGYGQSLSPGNEQRDFWGSASANVDGSRNVIGIKNPIIDALVKTLVQADTREQLVTACRALDRVLLAGYYVIPQWHINSWRVAYWDIFERPAKVPPYGLAVESWWINPKKLAHVRTTQQAGGN